MAQSRNGRIESEIHGFRGLRVSCHEVVSPAAALCVRAAVWSLAVCLFFIDRPGDCNFRVKRSACGNRRVGLGFWICNLMEHLLQRRFCNMNRARAQRIREAQNVVRFASLTCVFVCGRDKSGPHSASIS